MQVKDENSINPDDLRDLERVFRSRIGEVRAAAVNYLRAYVQGKSEENQLREAFERIKEVENAFEQIVSRISHWRRRMEYLVDLKRYGWAEEGEETELEETLAGGAEWEYYTLIGTRLGPLRRRLTYLLKKRAEKVPLGAYERAELGFLRSLAVDSIVIAEPPAEEALPLEERPPSLRCPAGARFGYDCASLEDCDPCSIRAACAARMHDIEEEFRRMGGT
jgi:hypothetical protein